jgi:hypothetical protein
MKITFKKKPGLTLMSIVPQSTIENKKTFKHTPEWDSYIRNMIRRKLVTVTFEWEDDILYKNKEDDKNHAV